jgi:hypothetical protein
MTERKPANAEMLECYMDGFDVDAPEPSANRSYSYRHGFAVGRADKAGKPLCPTIQETERLADAAMAADE